jgi:hypothetical protein
MTDVTDDALAARERELAETEVKIDRQDREAQALLRQLERDRVDAVRRLDLAEVRALDGQLDKVKGELTVLKEVRAMLSQQLAELNTDKAQRAEAAWVEAHGPRPCSYLSIADRLTRLGLDGHLVASIVPVVESHQHSVAWAEDPDRFMPGASPQELERVALALSKLISLIHGRDDEAEQALALAREYARDEAHRRRPAHPWRTTGPGAFTT